jgi:hypothetical protein
VVRARKRAIAAVRRIKMSEWIPRIYSENNPGDLNTLYGQLSRIATNRAVYLSLIKMTNENNVNIGELVVNFITDGYGADLVMTVRRLVESNKNKRVNKQVNSILALVEALNNEELLIKTKRVAESIGDAPNKIYGHNDLMYADGERSLDIASYNKFDQALKDLHYILIEAGKILEVFMPDKLVATNQFDWGVAFDQPWRDKGFDDYEIWNEL